MTLEEWKEYLNNLKELKLGANKLRHLSAEFKYYYFLEKHKRLYDSEFELLFDLNWWKENVKTFKDKIILKCNKCGNKFERRITKHLEGQECFYCINKNKKLSYQEFIKKAIQIHGDKYVYPFDEDWWDKNYKGVYTKIPIICPTHGLFYQTVKNHIHKERFGCSICKSSKGELKIKSILEKYSINYIHQHRVTINNSNYYFDFYLPDYNIFIEYDGEQHFEPKLIFGGEKEFEKIRQRDKIKTFYAKQNNIKLVRIPYYKYDKIEYIIQNLKDNL